MQPAEIVQTKVPKVSCDGNGSGGHPLVYLTVGTGAHVDCPYCGRRFVLESQGE